MTNRAEINPLRFCAGLAVLLVVLFLQIFSITANWHFNLVLATLIAFAYIFDFLELLIFDLLAVFILNWQPMPSVTLIVFALIPLAVFFVRKTIHSEPWIGVLAAIIIGFLVFYVTAGPAFFFPQFLGFFVDVVVAMIVGELVLVGLG